VSNESRAAGLDYPATDRRATTVFKYPLRRKRVHTMQPRACDLCTPNRIHSRDRKTAAMLRGIAAIVKHGDTASGFSSGA